jgi:hypothetical protein
MYLKIPPPSGVAAILFGKSGPTADRWLQVQVLLAHHIDHPASVRKHPY